MTYSSDEERSMVPTVVVGIGGTGREVIARTRRLVEDTYGDLKSLPIMSFLAIDTDKDYKLSNPEAAGSKLRDDELHWARVTGGAAAELMKNMPDFISEWFPNQLSRNLSALDAGAGQIRAYGRFAFYCNYSEIEQKLRAAVNRTRGKQNIMKDRYGISVTTNSVNVFVTGSLSGGTGSGMILDIAYCIRKWLANEQPTVTAIVPMPNAFASVAVGERVLANGYAAMMELSYYSDHRTEFRARYTTGGANEVRDGRSPFDFVYLVGTKNGETDFRLDQIREMIAQNIFLDMTSDFANHKRTIRDNIKSAWVTPDPEGRGYPKNFMSFGISTIEIPVTLIRSSLASRLARDLINWWLNDKAELPPQMQEHVKNDILKPIRLADTQITTDLAAANDRPYIAVISEWINSLRKEIASEGWLQCTLQGIKVIGKETGKITRFVGDYLVPTVDDYRASHFSDQSPDERVHGDFLKKMYSNRNDIIVKAKQQLENEFYTIIEDRNRGPKYADMFIVTTRQILDTAAEKYRREQERLTKIETNKSKKYEKALQDVGEFKDRHALTKQSAMEAYCEDALSGLEGVLVSTIQRKAFSLGLQVVARLQEHLNEMELRLNQFNQRLKSFKGYFQTKADEEADKADALEVNGIKLHDRYELNDYYQDLIAQQAGGMENNRTRFDNGMDTISSVMSSKFLKEASPLWKEDRSADEVMRLLDLTEIDGVKDEDLKEILFAQAEASVVQAPATAKVQKELSACDRIFKIYPNEEDIESSIRVAYQKSKPLIQLDKGKLLRAAFKTVTNQNVAVLGGLNTPDAAAQKIVPKFKQFIGGDDNIKPLGNPEKHRIVFVQETGGFSLRCVDGMQQLRDAYQEWKGDVVKCVRENLKGGSRELPIPVHIHKSEPVWDISPEDNEIFKLAIQARAFRVLREEINKTTKEQTIRYSYDNGLEVESIDIASNWEEVIQVLEVPVCQPDREEIQKQVSEILNALDDEAQRKDIYSQVVRFREQRALDLDKSGGKDSPQYKREAEVINDLILKYRLKVNSSEAGEAISTDDSSQPPSSPVQVDESEISRQSDAVEQEMTTPTRLNAEPQGKKAEWYFAMAGQRIGPVSLKDLINQDKLDINTLVWKKGMKAWQKTGDVPEVSEWLVPPLPPEEEGPPPLPPEEDGPPPLP